jgi:hypothetical protein
MFGIDKLISLRLINIWEVKKFFNLFALNSSFNHLESLVLNDIAENRIEFVVSLLRSLPRLYSLTIIGKNIKTAVSVIYPPRFSLPVLKYARLSLETYGTSVSLPIAPNNCFSSIEHLTRERIQLSNRFSVRTLCIR